MRTRLLVALAFTSACGAPPPPSSEPPPAPASTWSRVAVAGTLEVSLRDHLTTHGDGTGAVFRLTNHGDTSLLVDLRSVERAPRPDAPSGLRLPLSDAQIAELSETSALTQVGAGATASYAVPFDGTDCTGARAVAIGGTLVALDGPRMLELVADGAEGHLSCDAPTPAPAATVWIDRGGSLAAPDRDAASFTNDFPTLLRAASVSGAGDVALLAFSYDGRAVERWRYDACVAAGTCPARTIPQPPGSIRAPAVGMSSAGVEAFCATRSLRGATAAELEAVADPGRALVASDAPDVVTSGFRCARSESEAPPPP